MDHISARTSFPYPLPTVDADGRYEAMCRFFKSFKPPPPPPTASRNRHHDSLIDEAEAELASGLTWHCLACTSSFLDGSLKG
jgi:hypothetical protein